MVMKKGVCQPLTHSPKYIDRDAPKTVQIYINPYENKGLQTVISLTLELCNKIDLLIECECVRR